MWRLFPERKRRVGTYSCDLECDALDWQEGSFIYTRTRSTYSRGPSLSGEVVVTVNEHIVA
jgi:hypothetical protein